MVLLNFMNYHPLTVKKNAFYRFIMPDTAKNSYNSKYRNTVNFNYTTLFFWFTCYSTRKIFLKINYRAQGPCKNFNFRTFPKKQF